MHYLQTNIAFQSTLPARGATAAAAVMGGRTAISIHAPRTGSDPFRNPRHFRLRISIHAPRTGSDAAFRAAAFAAIVYFNPRSPHGERRISRVAGKGNFCISIHAPRTGSDADARLVVGFDGYFNPRSPHGERRGERAETQMDSAISIHAPRTGSDCSSQDASSAGEYFNPRSPHGERRVFTEGGTVRNTFQSTLPARGATSPFFNCVGTKKFQSTLPARGATSR